MKTSIYINPKDKALFARAKELGGDLSPIIAEAVRRHVALLEAQAGGMEEVTLEVGIWRTQGADDVKKVRFVGRLLANGREYTGSTSDGRDRWRDIAIYQTNASRFITYWQDGSLWQGESASAGHEVLNHLPDGGDDERIHIPGSLLQEAAAALGRELVEWVE